MMETYTIDEIKRRTIPVAQKYGDEIAFTVQEHALDFRKLSDSITPKNALSMCILQIGELVGRLLPPSGYRLIGVMI